MPIFIDSSKYIWRIFLEYIPLLYSPNVFLVPYIYLSSSVNYLPLEGKKLPRYIFLYVVLNIFQGVTSPGFGYNFLPSHTHTLMLQMMFAIWRAWEKTWGLCQSISWIEFRMVAPICDEVEITCMRVTVEASITNHVRDFVPDLEKYKAM